MHSYKEKYKGFLILLWSTQNFPLARALSKTRFSPTINAFLHFGLPCPSMFTCWCTTIWCERNPPLETAKNEKSVSSWSPFTPNIVHQQEVEPLSLLEGPFLTKKEKTYPVRKIRNSTMGMIRWNRKKKELYRRPFKRPEYESGIRWFHSSP